MGVKPFDHATPKCVKCRAGNGNPVYVVASPERLPKDLLRLEGGITRITDAETNAGLSCDAKWGCPDVEHLHWTCTWCGYFWMSLTADAR